MNAKELLKTFETRIKTDTLSADDTGNFHFHLSGEGGGDFTVELKNKKVKVKEGLNGTPTCEIKAKAEDYLALEKGELSPQWAFMMGKVKVSNLSELMRFASYFTKLK
jgi:putative sterol carrier protein